MSAAAPRTAAAALGLAGVLAAAAPIAGCPTTSDFPESCDGLAGGDPVAYYGGAVHASVAGDWDEPHSTGGLLTLAEATGGLLQLQLVASNEGHEGATRTTLVVDCYHPGEPAADDTWDDPIAELSEAQAVGQCWAWYDLLAVDVGEGRTGHYVSDEHNTGTFSVTEGFEPPGADGTPGRAAGELHFDALEEQSGDAVQVREGTFEVPVCRL